MRLCAYAHVAAFDDRTVTLDAPDQLADVGSALANRTRLAVLGVLVRASEPMNINELARRVGVDASPVRSHLESLLKEGLIREVDAPSGRERRFETSLTNVRVTLEGVHRPPAPKGAPLPKPALRIQTRMEALARDLARLEEKGRKLQAELAKAMDAPPKERAKP